jgi:hypothetical protein
MRSNVHNGHVIATKAVSVTLANRFRHRFSRSILRKTRARNKKRENIITSKGNKKHSFD